MKDYSKKLIEHLNNYQFYDCKDVLMGDVLYYVIRDCEDVTLKSAIKAVVSSLVIMLSNNYEGNCKGTNIDTCAIYTMSCGYRKDHVDAYNDVIDVVENRLKINISKRKLSFKNLKLLPYFFRWINDLKNVGVKFNQRLYLANAMLQAQQSYNTVMDFVKSKSVNLKNLIVWCDVMSDDSFIVQKLNARNVKTVTLCHANFNIIDNSWAYKGAHSDVFILHSTQAKNNAKKAGCQSNLLIAGDPHNISKPQNSYVKIEDIKTIGIILNGALCDDINEKMIVFLQEYAKQSSKKVVIKLHPSNDYEKLKNVIDNGITKVYGKEISISQFADLIDVAIVSNSNVFYEMLFLYKPLLVYAVEEDYHLCDDYSSLKFKDLDEFMYLIVNIPTNNYKKYYVKCRDFYISSGGIRDNYARCFKEIGIS